MTNALELLRRAEEADNSAKTARDPEAVQLYRDIAAAYRQLARIAERNAQQQ